VTHRWVSTGTKHILCAHGPPFVYTSCVAVPIFQLTFAVKDSDIDPLGHVNNIAYVRWIQDVAVAHSAAVGMDFAAYGRLGGVFVVRRHEIDYLRPVLRSDRVVARTWISGVMAAKCHRSTELVRASDGQVLARALTTWGFIEMATGRPRRIPDEVRAAFDRFIHREVTA
jgi:acyl-CoA thioester hydrolase